MINLNVIFFKNYYFLLTSTYFLLNISIIYNKSLTQNYDYPQFCKLASQENTVFKTFRKNNSVLAVVETCHTYDSGIHYANELRIKYPHLLPYLKKICEEDIVGTPISFYYPQIGTISPTVLRYITIAGELQKLFGDLNILNIVEIGGGVGGQCKIISDIYDFASYTIIDLPNCTPLINKYLNQFNIQNFKTIDSNAIITPTQYDLVVSNFAFSEMDSTEQLHYITTIIKEARHGYMIYNKQPSIQPFLVEEFIALLREHNKNAKIIRKDESDNDVVVW